MLAIGVCASLVAADFADGLLIADALAEFGPVPPAAPAWLARYPAW